MSDPTTTPAQQQAKTIQDLETIVSDVAVAVSIVSKTNLWSAILGFFTALPGIVSLIQNFMSWINTISGNNPQAIISNLGQAFSQLAAAKTVEEKQNAASNLAGLIAKLPTK